MSHDVLISTQSHTTDTTIESEVNGGWNQPPLPPIGWKSPGGNFHSYSLEFLFPETEGKVNWDLFTPPTPPLGWKDNYNLTSTIDWQRYTPPPPTSAESLVSHYCGGVMFTTYLVVHTILCSLGIIGNSVSVAVIHFNSRKSVTNLILKMLAVLDNVYLIVAIVHIYMTYRNSILQKKISIYLYTTSRVVQLACIGQIIIVGLYRYIAICWPFKASNFCTYTNAYISVGLNILVAIAVNIPLYMWNANPKSLPKTWQFTKFYWGLFYEIGLYFALPLTLLLLFTVSLIRALWKSAKIHQHHAKQTVKEAREVTAVVIAIVVVFIVSYTPGTVFHIDKYFFGQSFYQNQSCTTYAVLFFFVSLSPYINSAVNFFIYFFLRKSFRSGLKALLLCKKIQANGRRSSETVETIV